ncbi:MAG: histidinol dehydrogenase [Phycisphaerae bacterium]|nr:histidinol dehydrogenase [Phycisphaerae bacterium]
MSTFPERAPAALRRSGAATVDTEARRVAETIVDRVLRGGRAAALREARRHGELGRGEPLVRDRRDCLRGLARLARADRDALARAAARIERFARAQRRSLSDLTIRTGNAEIGHRVVPLASAGCYAPGGRYPLPSSALMTAIPARVAGVSSVTAASPRPVDAMLAAAALAGADRVLAIGGAQAIALLARGDDEIPRCDVLVGPGNRYVTAAKAILRERGLVAIDMLAGPSELLVVADQTADPDHVAADLLAQAEHDPASAVWLVSIGRRAAIRACARLDALLSTLPTATIARRALRRGGFAVVASRAEAARVADALAPEHLAVATRRPTELLRACRSYGAAFLAPMAEVFGDYGIGPNHTLPTGGAARTSQGLSVLDFVRLRPYASGAVRAAVARDTVRLAHLEGLAAHAASAALRLTDAPSASRRRAATPRSETASARASPARATDRTPRSRP